MSKRNLDRFGPVLDAMLAEARGDRNSHLFSDPEKGELSDMAAIAEGNAVTAASLNRLSANELRIMAARLRVRNGVYGVCALCKKDIPLTRLNAVPEAECCVKCQDQFNAEYQNGVGNNSDHDWEASMAYLANLQLPDATSDLLSQIEG